MKKSIKAIATAAAGAALLLGAGGTFATWTDTVALGAGTNTIYTGDLDLTGDLKGEWRWYKQSYTINPTKVGQPYANTGTTPSKLVPGDAVRYHWTAVPSIVLTGDTLHANLYFYVDGVAVTIADLKPLVVQVNGVRQTANYGSQNTSIASVTPQSDSSSVLNTTNANQETYPTLPRIVIGLPALAAADAVAPGTPHADDPTGRTGYGRNRTLENVINPANIQVRLTQQTTGSDVFTNN